MNRVGHEPRILEREFEPAAGEERRVLKSDLRSVLAPLASLYVQCEARGKRPPVASIATVREGRGDFRFHERSKAAHNCIHNLGELAVKFHPCEESKQETA